MTLPPFHCHIHNQCSISVCEQLVISHLISFPIKFHHSLFFQTQRIRRRYMLYLALSAKLCSTIFFFGAWWSYIPPKHMQQNNGQSDINMDNNEPEQEIMIYNNNRTHSNDN